MNIDKESLKTLIRYFMQNHAQAQKEILARHVVLASAYAAMGEDAKLYPALEAARNNPAVVEVVKGQCDQMTETLLRKVDELASDQDLLQWLLSNIPRGPEN